MQVKFVIYLTKKNATHKPAKVDLFTFLKENLKFKVYAKKINIYKMELKNWFVYFKKVYNNF